MQEQAETTAAVEEPKVVSEPTVVKPTKEQIKLQQLDLFKLREGLTNSIAQCRAKIQECNAKINELEGMLKEK